LFLITNCRSSARTSIVIEELQIQLWDILERRKAIYNIHIYLICRYAFRYTLNILFLINTYNDYLIFSSMFFFNAVVKLCVFLLAKDPLKQC
jgi:hypothetical protein